VVWRARDEELGDLVALKFLPEVVARDDAAVDELREETREARRLTHPNIVRVHQFERDGASAAVSMEYVDGTTLSKLRLAQPGKVFSAEKLAPLVAQLCAALDYAHGVAKVVHRDLKPANLLITPEGWLKIADFGIARSLADTHTRLTGRTVGTSGTLLYMSPQQLLGKKASASDDIYALGATLYELLTGRPPFFTGDIATQVQRVTPPPLAERRSELGIGGEPIPAAWEKTVAACLAKDLAQRPQTAGEVAARLGLAEAKGTVAGSSLMDDRRPATSAGPTKSRMSRVLLLAGLAVLALGVLAYSYWPRMRSTPATGHLVPSTAKPVTSFEEIRTKAERGDADAQAKLGLMYAKGDGVPKDSTEAAKWYRKAADQGNAKAQCNLGVMYAKGDGVPQDSAEAAGWYRKAADQAYAAAQCNLGVIYATGNGVPKDSAEAVRWFQKAADQGYALAKCGLGVMYAEGEGVPKDSAEAVRWFRKAADQGDAVAQHYLGVMYAKGDGVPEDSAEAARWYRKAADQGNAMAQWCLGAVYAKGDGVPKDSAEAARWYRKAADQGNAYGQRSLGEVYAHGDGVLKDETEALAWYNLAAASGDETAMKNRDTLELSLGHQTSLAAQQRSKEILTEIETAKAHSAGSEAVNSSPPKSSGTGAIVSAHGPDEGQTWTIPDLGLELVPIRAGEFTMGSPASENGRSDDEGPQTRVTITRAFWLGKTEVTQGQWEALMGSNPSNFTGADRPVEQVSWSDAMKFCRKLTERERAAGRLPKGYTYTLPTEAQWEYACRAGTTGDYAGNLDDMGWYRSNSGSTTHPAGQKQPNAWGLYDMHGNVWEYCADWYGSYPGGSVTDPSGPSSWALRGARGGCWFADAGACRSAVRFMLFPDVRYREFGFRVALAPQVNQTATKTVPVAANRTAAVSASLEKQVFPKPGQAWENTLGMKFAPVPGTGVLFCIWETRVQDFEAFVKDTGYDATGDMYSVDSDGWKQRGNTWRSPGFSQEPTHPVCGVSWDDAKAFCRWLTKKERREGRLGPNQEYRLPTDAEWSAAVGLDEPGGGTPESRDGQVKGVYPWGTHWPPPRGAGNFAGTEVRDGNWPSAWSVIEGYSDGYPRTAPVGSFSANRYGLFDLSGNVWEWCEDYYNGSNGGRVLRGGSFDERVSGHLLSSYRVIGSRGSRRDYGGFRCVVVVSAP
jgi:formylglycine-generating enzyme required for sulfatase activity